MTVQQTEAQPRNSAVWGRFVPWQGRPGRVDLALMGAILAVVAFGLALRPLKPFLLASHPVALEFFTGDLTAIGAAPRSPGSARLRSGWSSSRGPSAW